MADFGPNVTDLTRKVVLSHKLTQYVDLNTDFGQTRDQQFFEKSQYGLLKFVSSVNLPCCVHDGDPKVILDTIAIAKTFSCTLGAHIAYPDPVHYGYEVMNLDADELAAWIHLQMGAFRALAQAQATEIEHVRPHGALYTKFLTDPETALLVAKTLYKINPWLRLVAPPGPILKEVEEKTGIRTAPEAYLGKRYSAEGAPLVNHLHENLPRQGVLDQARQLIQQSSVTTADGRTVKVDFKTIHISPQLDGAVEVAERISQMLIQPVSLPLADIGASGWI